MVPIWVYDQIFSEKIALTDHATTTKSSVIFQLDGPFRNDKETWEFDAVKFHFIEFKDMFFNDLEPFCFLFSLWVSDLLRIYLSLGMNHPNIGFLIGLG